MTERRHLSSRRLQDQEEQCPLTVECVRKLIARLETVEQRTNAIPDMTQKVNELHEKLIQARGFVAGMRLGATSVFILIASFFIMVYGFLTGKISLKDLLTGMF